MDWERCYDEARTPWDLFGITPPLENLLASGDLSDWGLPEHARVAVPGCGRGHDLRAWAALGHEVTGFDVVPKVVDEARQLLDLNQVEGVEVLQRDVLGLAHEFPNYFDVVFDYTCFCALPPHLRGTYARELAEILRPGGILLHLAFPGDAEHAGRPGHPPFEISRADVEDAFSPVLDAVFDAAVSDSAIARRGAEHWYVWQKC